MAVTNGFDMRAWEGNIDIETDNRFQKLNLTEDQVAQINNLVGAAPALIGAETLSNAFILTFPEGVEGALVKLKRGGYTTTIRDVDTGKFAGTAALEPIQLEAAMLGAFTAMSIASGQYFLSEINSKLNMMKLSIDKILEFLYGDKRAELMSEISFIRFAYKNYGSIMDHEDQRVSTITSLQNSRKVAMKDIEFYLADLAATAGAKDQNDILATVSKSIQIKDGLELSIQLYVVSNMLEVFYSQNYNKAFLQYVEDEAAAYITKCDKRILTSFSMLQQTLTSHKDGLFKKIGKDILEATTQQVGAIVEELNTIQTSPMQGLLHSALSATRKKDELYINGDGSVFLKVS